MYIERRYRASDASVRQMQAENFDWRNVLSFYSFVNLVCQTWTLAVINWTVVGRTELTVLTKVAVRPITVNSMSVYQDSTVCTNTASIARVHLQQLMQTVGLKTVVKSALLVFLLEKVNLSSLISAKRHCTCVRNTVRWYCKNPEVQLCRSVPGLDDLVFDLRNSVVVVKLNCKHVILLFALCASVSLNPQIWLVIKKC